jgi:hypothetical protein
MYGIHSRGVADARNARKGCPPDVHTGESTSSIGTPSAVRINLDPALTLPVLVQNDTRTDDRSMVDDLFFLLHNPRHRELVSHPSDVLR